MAWKFGVVIGVVAAGLALSAGVAFADDDTDVEGGGCEYGDASVNIMPSCDTSNSTNSGDARRQEDLRDSLDQLPRTLEPPLRPVLNDLRPSI